MGRERSAQASSWRWISPWALLQCRVLWTDPIPAEGGRRPRGRGQGCGRQRSLGSLVKSLGSCPCFCDNANTRGLRRRPLLPTGGEALG